MKIIRMVGTLLFSLTLTGCILVLPVPDPRSLSGMTFNGRLPCQNTPMPALISCTTSIHFQFTTPFYDPDYIDKSLKTAQKAYWVVDVLIDIALKIRKIVDLFK